MSPLARRIAWTTVILLGMQFVSSLVLQMALAGTFRASLVTQVYRDLEGSGMFTDCVARPGPWSLSTDTRTAWPVSPEGFLVGEHVPLDRVDLPQPGQTISLRQDGKIWEIYGSTSPGCGGIAHVVPGSYPALEFFSTRMAGLGTLRFLLAVLVGVALVALTAVPLVRRIRALSHAMSRVVQAGFEGTIEDPTPDELGDVARAFNTAATTVREQLLRLEHRDVVLRRALADFAHDLRTPLTTLQLSVSRLHASDASSKMRGELAYLQGMMRNFESVLVGDAQSEVVAVALDRLLERVQHRFAPLANSQKHQLRDRASRREPPRAGRSARGGAGDQQPGPQRPAFCEGARRVAALPSGRRGSAGGP